MLPAALLQFLKDHPCIDDIALLLNNDITGRLVAKAIQTILASMYTVSDEPPKHGKDVNGYLKNVLEMYQPWVRE